MAPSLTIRRIQLGDAPALASLMRDRAVFPGLLQSPYLSDERLRKMIEGNEAPGITDLMLVALSGERLVACASLHAVGPSVRRRHAMSLGISVAPEAQGQGVGTAILRSLIDYADNWGQVLRIELTVYTDNARAIALYRRCGFVDEGVHRAYGLRDGVYADVVSMARLHPRPPQLPLRGE